MRYSKQISTGLMIESQSGGNPDNPLHLSTMVDNAVNGGLLESDVEVGYCTDEEHQDMIGAKDVANDIANPLQKWVRDITATDSSCPRWFEDYVTENSVALAPGKSKESYDAKVALRGEKP